MGFPECTGQSPHFGGLTHKACCGWASTPPQAPVNTRLQVHPYRACLLPGTQLPSLPALSPWLSLKATCSVWPSRQALLRSTHKFDRGGHSSTQSSLPVAHSDPVPWVHGQPRCRGALSAPTPPPTQSFAGRHSPTGAQSWGGWASRVSVSVQATATIHCSAPGRAGALLT